MLTLVRHKLKLGRNKVNHKTRDPSWYNRVYLTEEKFPTYQKATCMYGEKEIGK